MLEKRVKVKNIEKAKKKIMSLGANYKGNYAFQDIIFVSKKERTDLNKDFIRVRVYSKNNWKTKNVILVRKKTIWKDINKTSKVILKKEFDKEKEAFDFMDKKYNLQFENKFEYYREGWEYQFNLSHVFIENVEKIGSTVEIESENKNEMEDLFNKIGVEKILEDSMPEIMRKRLNE